MRVLVVDDNVDAANTLGVLLRFEQHQVDIVYDARAALEKARVVPPAIVFMDIAMPGMNGYELARRLREMPECRHVVLVALSGYPAQDVAAEAAGIEFYLTKPADIRRVLSILEDLKSRPLRK
jgi:two-component system CheB/CheR fusion protein